MDGPGPFLTRLRDALVAFDDNALAALANKGLVRRARKDLEIAAARILDPESTADGLRVEVADAVADLKLPPARSRCSCPASGICRHILAALIHVKENAPASIEPAGAIPATVDAEILNVDDEMLARWAGKPLLARASKLLAQGLPVQFEAGDGLAARLPTRNATCRWMPGGGLDGMLCSCHLPGACEHRVAAILAFQAARGSRVLDNPADDAMSASSGAPRSRQEVLTSVGDAVGEMVALGLSRLSRATAERLRTLSVSAHGVDLPRLERLLRGLASEVELGLARDAQADASRLLGQAARVEALRVALGRGPSAHLVGQHKTVYEAVGNIELVGLGARAWRTGSGYAGLTVFFWDRSAGNWATWTEARPLGQGGFDPVSRYRSDGPWPGMSSPLDAARKSIRLTAAWRNRQGRLSGRSSCQAMTLGRSEPESVPDRITRWDLLAERARRIFRGGFRHRIEQDAIVLLAPTSWGPAVFDPVRQELMRIVGDEQGRPVPLVLRHDKANEDAIEVLTDHDPSATLSVLGILQMETGRLSVEPIALHTREGVISLTLDTAARSSSPARTPVLGEEPEDDELEASGDDVPEPSGSRLGRLLASIAMSLLAIAEGGPAAFRSIPEMRALGIRAGAIGLSSVGQAVGRVVLGLEAQRKGEGPDPAVLARDLLLAAHIVRLSQAQEAVASAIAPLG